MVELGTKASKTNNDFYDQTQELEIFLDKARDARRMDTPSVWELEELKEQPLGNCKQAIATTIRQLQAGDCTSALIHP